jgi:hypothetical protein
MSEGTTVLSVAAGFFVSNIPDKKSIPAPIIFVEGGKVKNPREKQE